MRYASPGDKTNEKRVTEIPLRPSISEIMILELHIHSRFSYDSLLSPEKIVKAAEKKGMDGIAITDHNTIEGGLKAQSANKNGSIAVIVGSEVNTDAGDLRTI